MLILMFAAAIAAVTSTAQTKVCAGRHLATVEADGSVSAGSHAALLAAALDGASLRVGWQLGASRTEPVLTHWQDARFVTVFEGQVFTQIGDIRAQTPMRDRAHIALTPDGATWSGSLGANGKLVGSYSTEAKPTEIAVVSHWCLAS